MNHPRLSRQINIARTLVLPVLFLAGCSALTGPTPTATPMPTDTAVPTVAPTPTATSAPAPTSEGDLPPSPTPSGGSNGQIVFMSKRGGDYDDLYIFNAVDASVVRLTSGDSNTFPGPFSP